MQRRSKYLQPAAVFQPMDSDAYRPSYSYITHSGLQLDTTVHGAESPERVIINCLPWSEYSQRPDATARYATMASAISKGAPCVVVSVDNPGVGAHGTTLNSQQRKMLRAGQLEPFAEMQYEALAATAEKAGLQLAGAALMGYSLGTVMAAQLARFIQPSKLVLIEPVGAHKSKRLASDFVHDSLRDGAYRKENPQWYKDLPTTMTSQRFALYDYFKMMASGGHFDILEGLHDTTTTLVRGGESRVSTSETADAIAAYIPGAERWTLEGENHSMLNSLGRVASLTSQLHAHGRL